MKCDHIVGYWSDGYEFQLMYVSSLKNYITNPFNSEDMYLFEYCPNCAHGIVIEQYIKQEK